MREVARRDVLEGAAGISSVAPLGKIQQSTSDGETNSKRVNYLRINFELTSRPDEAAVDVAPRAWPAVLEHDNNFYLPEHVPDNGERFIIASPRGVESLNGTETWEYTGEVPVHSNMMGGSDYISNSKLELEAVQWGNRCYLIIGGEVIPVTPGGISEVKQLYYIHDGEYKIGNMKINAGYHNQAEVVYSDDGYVLPNIEQARNMIASRKDSLSTYYTNADSEISVDQQNGAIVANLSKSTNEVSKSDYSRESVDLDGPTPSTLVLVAETTRSADDPSWYDTNVKANFVEKWNEQIYESPGYALGARVPSNLSSGPNRVDIPVPDTAKEGMKLANDWISEETDWMGRFDAIVVLDNAGLTGTNGRAPKGRKNNTAAGTNDRMVGYADNSFSSGLALHELGHMYGGRHTHHRKKGWDKFTIMGNRGNTTCGGNKSEFWRTRNEKFSDCAKDTIKEYMQYCYDEKDYF